MPAATTSVFRSACKNIAPWLLAASDSNRPNRDRSSCAGSQRSGNVVRSLVLLMLMITSHSSGATVTTATSSSAA